jgi:protein YIPF1/2
MDLNQPNLDFTINLADPEKGGSTPNKASETVSSAPLIVKREQSKAPTGACGVFSIDYWREYFDVTEQEIIAKVKAAVNPTTNEFEQLIEAKIDLYGPFWISTSLIFSMIVAPGIWSIFSSTATFDVTKVGFGFTLIYGSALAFTFLFFFLTKFMGLGVPLFRTASIYGYSYTIFILACLVSILNLWILTFVSCMGAGFHSVLFLLKNFRPTIEKLDATNKLCAIGFIGVLQSFVTLMIFFNYLK